MGQRGWLSFSLILILMYSVLKKYKSIKLRSYNIRYWFSDKLFPLNQNDKKLKQFHNSHFNERCFIIGNGPSLNKLDLTRLKNEYTFGVNAIYTNYERMGFYPTYYAVEDIYVAEDRSQEINSYKHSVKFFPNYLKHCLMGDYKTIFINFVSNYGSKKFPGFSENAASKIYFGGTVSYVCLQLAYYMGFSKVYLIGFDHNYLIPKEALISGTEILSTSDDPNHFSPTYFGKGKRWHDPKVERMELSYKKAKEVFEKDKRKIYNATAGGKLEVFERKDYDLLF